MEKHIMEFKDMSASAQSSGRERGYAVEIATAERAWEVPRDPKPRPAPEVGDSFVGLASGRRNTCTRARCILQVEDDWDFVWLLNRAFQKAGITDPVQVASDGQMAIDLLAGTGPYADRGKYPVPCLVLLDLHLPAVPGLAVLEWIRQQPALEGLAVVLISSLAHPADIARANELGANLFLEKPSDSWQLLDFARLLKDRWLGHKLLSP
jgi:CheY-like chemotaxis protein